MIKTEIDNQKEQAQFLIEYCSGDSFTIAFKENTEITGRGVKDKYNERTYEVTRNKLEQLKGKFTWYTNF